MVLGELWRGLQAKLFKKSSGEHAGVTHNTYAVDLLLTPRHSRARVSFLGLILCPPTTHDTSRPPQDARRPPASRPRRRGALRRRLLRWLPRRQGLRLLPPSRALPCSAPFPLPHSPRWDPHGGAWQDLYKGAWDFDIYNDGLFFAARSSDPARNMGS